MVTHYQAALADVPHADDFARGNLDGDVQLPKAPIRDPVVMDWEALTEPRLQPVHDVVGQALASFFTREGGKVYLTQQMIADACRLSRVTVNKALQDLEACGRFVKHEMTTYQGHRGHAYQLTGENSQWVPARLEVADRLLPLQGKTTIAGFLDKKRIAELEDALRFFVGQVGGAVKEIPNSVSAVLESLSDSPYSEELSEEYRKLDFPDTSTALLSDSLNSALAERPVNPATERQINTIMMHQERTGLAENDVLASWPDIDRYSAPPQGIDASLMNTVQASRAIQWLRGQKDAPVEEPEPWPAAETVCTCADSEEVELPEPQPEAAAAWKETLAQLEKELPRTTFDTWLKGTEGICFKGLELWVSVPSVFNVAWLEQRMYQSILKALRRSSGEELDVMFRASSASRDCLVHPPTYESQGPSHGGGQA